MMRRARTAVFAAVAVAVVMVATACYPPSQTPTGQPIPPGGRVVATGPVLTVMWIEDATPDLSTIVYGRHPFLVVPGDPIPNSFWVYDDHTGRTTAVPVGGGESGSAAIAPDGRSVVFSSNDPSLQIGPTALNCLYGQAPWSPGTPTVCSELYLFDLHTGLTRQLTGLDGSSPYGHFSPKFSSDGTAVDFLPLGGAVPQPYTSRRLDLATGVISDSPPGPPCCAWDRGGKAVSWDGATGTLTSTDTTTGQVTTLWANADVFDLDRAIDNGRFVVLSRWVTDQTQVFRLIDTDTGSVREVSSPWIKKDGSTYAVAQQNVAPDGIDRLIIAPLPS